MNERRHRLVFWAGFCVIVALLAVAPLVLPEFWRRLQAIHGLVAAWR